MKNIKENTHGASVWDEYLVAEHGMSARAMAILKEQLEKEADGEHEPVKL